MTVSRELRIALVCYGGVSLAVYMHGITKELWKLLQASEERGSRRPPALSDSAAVWRNILDELGSHVDMTVICDVLSGASAGGINAVMLARAITGGLDMEPLRNMWLEQADITHMMDPEAQPARAIRRAAHFYKEPIAWIAGRMSENIAALDEEEVRTEVALKLTSFVRARWFAPPFSGQGLTEMLDDALIAMEETPPGPPLIPPTLGFDLAVTATDYHGVTAELAINSPPSVQEREHRRILHFRMAASGPRDNGNLPPRLADRPSLTFAARATSSFPGAFPPAEIGEIDRRLETLGEEWPGRQQFVAHQLAGDRPPEDVRLIDGSVLNNAPFGPALDAIRRRPAYHEVDRRFVYIDPKPGIHVAPKLSEKSREPGFFSAILRALADIPREQPIRDSLEAIGRVSARMRRIGAVISTMRPAVEQAIGRAVGPRFFFLRPTVARMARARSRTHSLAAREAGFAFAGYAQLKVRIVLDEAALLLHQMSGSQPNELARLRALVGAEADARHAYDQDGALSWGAQDSGYVCLLRRLDIGFRIRRLRFVLRWIAEQPEPQDEEGLAALEEVKNTLHHALAPIVALRSGAPLKSPALKIAAERLVQASEPETQRDATAAALDILGHTLNLETLDIQADNAMVMAATSSALDSDFRHGLVSTYLGFPYFDLAILPLMPEDQSDSFEALKVDRISPDDVHILGEGGTRGRLKGWQLNAFAGFFSRAYRENDYLWGRLNGAERLFDILISSAQAAGAPGLPEREWKAKLFRAILAEERSHLGKVELLIETLEQEIAAWR